MTIGIYALSFEGTDKVYIGQSVNIERRYTAHLNSLSTATANYKMMLAYQNHGKPKLNILVECRSEDLMENETWLIHEFDAVNNGLNILEIVTNVNSGYSSFSSKYSREDILDIVDLLCEGNSVRGTAKILGIPPSVVCNIQTGSQHVWVKEEFPEKHLKIRSFVKSAGALTASSRHSAKGRGYTYPSIMSPTGLVYASIENIARFAKEHNLSASEVSNVLNGKSKAHKGWRLA